MVFPLRNVEIKSKFFAIKVKIILFFPPFGIDIVNVRKPINKFMLAIVNCMYIVNYVYIVNCVYIVNFAHMELAGLAGMGG